MRAGLRVLFLCLVGGSLAGCQSGGPSLRLQSFKDPYFPETMTIRLDGCAYRADPSGDIHILGRANRAPDELGGGRVEQILHIHTFWRPRPGKTFDNPTSVDSTIRYVIKADDGVRVYEGTGFVYLAKARVGSAMLADIENMRLRPASVSGAPPDVIGEARLSGKLRARLDPSAVVDGIRECQLMSGGG